MALDVYVAPLWRFKSGKFTSPVEQVTGIQPTVISLAGERPPARPPWYVRLLAAVGVAQIAKESPRDPETVRVLAVAEVDTLKAEISRLAGQTVDWRDEGEVCYGEQFHAAAFLRALAAWYDHREEMPDFRYDAAGRYTDDYPVWKLPAPTQRHFPVLTGHSLHTGYLLPAAFEGVHRVEPFKVMDHWEFYHDVASSLAALQEVDELLAWFAEMTADGNSPARAEQLETARGWAQELRKICALSVEHSLPVIFHG